MTLPPDPSAPPAVSPGAPLTVPPLPASEPQAHRRFMANRPSWILSIILVGLLGYVLAHTYFTSTKAEARDTSEMTEKTLDAVQETKLAFAEGFFHYVALEAPPAAPASKKSPPSAVKSPSVDGARSERESPEDHSIRLWRELARAKSGTAYDWRRLGITLSVFGKPGSLEALRHVSDPRKPPAPSSSRRLSRHARKSEQLTPLMPPADEVALWQAIYGPGRLTVAEVQRLRPQLAKLNLGWFENLAAAQLFAKAGMHAEALDAEQEARSAAAQVKSILDWRIGFFVIGLVCLIVFGVNALAKLSRSSSPPYVPPPFPYGNAYATGAIPYPYSVPPVPSRPAIELEGMPAPAGSAASARMPSVPYSFAAAQSVTPPPSFSYRARLIAFLVYYAGFIGIGYLVGLALRGLSPIYENWSNQALLRLNVAANLILYIPVVFLALWTLKRLTQTETGRKISWREVLAGVGFRTEQPLQDIGAGFYGYSITYPLFFIAAIISSILFSRFHTPVNPVEFDTMVTKNLLDRFLLLVEAAVAAPIVEELMFRGLLFPALRARWGVWLGAALSAAIFSLSHNTLPGGFLPIWTLGFTFALAYQWRRSLLPGIIMHGIHNGLITLTLFAIFAQ